MPSDTSGYPADFQRLIDSYNIASDTLMEQLETGKLTPKQWEKTMQATLGKYGQAAMLLGSGENALSESQSGPVRSWLGDQMSYLKNFAKVVTGDFNPAWKPRARMYGASTYTEYWEGKTEGLALPAQPAQNTTCLGNCKCRWEIKWLNKKKGDADCYWRLGSTDLHCQVCLTRAEMWNPVRIRGGDLQE